MIRSQDPIAAPLVRARSRAPMTTAPSEASHSASDYLGASVPPLCQQNLELSLGEILSTARHWLYIRRAESEVARQKDRQVDRRHTAAHRQCLRCRLASLEGHMGIRRLQTPAVARSSRSPSGSSEENRFPLERLGDERRTLPNFLPYLDASPDRSPCHEQFDCRTWLSE